MGAYINISDRPTLIYNLNCLICHEDFSDSTDQKCYYLSCGHLWHSDCLNNWLQRASSCPICSRQIKILPSYKRYLKVGIFSVCLVGGSGLIYKKACHASNEGINISNEEFSSISLSKWILTALGVGFISAGLLFLKDRSLSKEFALLRGPIPFILVKDLTPSAPSHSKDSDRMLKDTN